MLLPISNDTGGYGRAILHATDIKFDESQGKNVLCMTPETDLQRTYKTEFLQTHRIQTHMQVSKRLTFSSWKSRVLPLEPQTYYDPFLLVLPMSPNRKTPSQWTLATL